MDIEKIEEFSNKYKNVQKKLSIAVMLFIILLGLVFIGVGIFLCVYEYHKVRLIIGIIMILAGLLNIALGIKFNRFSQKNISQMSKQEAARRYSRITGKK